MSKAEECVNAPVYITPPEDPSGEKCCDELREEIDGLKTSKQDKLTPGTGITIENNVISSTGGSVDLFVIVEELPEEGDQNKIYLLPDGEGGFTEYHYKDGNWDVVGSVEVDLSNYYNKTQTDTLLATKQNLLTAGDNVSITNDVISATDTTYTAGDNVTISSENEISVDLTQYIKKSEITKAFLLEILDYEETNITKTDTDNVVTTIGVLTKKEASNG